MAFGTGYLADPNKVAGGEKFGVVNIILSAKKGEWLGPLSVGRFAQSKAGVIQNMDATATPVIAGVVLRKASTPVEDNGTIDADLFDHVEYERTGLVSVDVKAGETAPELFGAVQAYNTAGADLGLAVATGGVATTAEFLEVIAPNVWLVQIK